MCNSIGVWGLGQGKGSWEGNMGDRGVRFGEVWEKDGLGAGSVWNLISQVSGCVEGRGDSYGVVWQAEVLGMWEI